jgi:electron transport complex protein RnfB
MSDGIYQRLRKAIAAHSAYFQATASGVEIDFLRKLFTEEEAVLYPNLTGRLETPRQIAERAAQDPEVVAAALRRMAGKGLVFPKRKGESYYYAASPFAHGILEHQVNRIDAELARIYEDYMWAEKLPEESAGDRPAEVSLPMRSIPVKTPVNISRPVAPYEDVKALIERQDRIAVARCFCAVQQQLLGSDCDQPLEVCLMLGFYGEYYVEQGMGRKISQEEALEILDMAEEAGLVHQIPDTQDPGAMLKMIPNPAALVPYNFFCRVDSDSCNGCEICLDRCSMGAIAMTSDQVAAIDLTKCIGCGLCLDTCPEEALTLVSKPDEQRREPPPTSRFMRSSRDIEGTIP